MSSAMSTPVSAVSTPAKRVSYSPLRRNTTTVKTSLDSPFRLKWPTVTHQNCEDIKVALKSALCDVRPPSRKEKKQEKKVTFNKDKRSFLIVGVNAVLRNMEKGVVKVGLLCSTTQPTLLHQHFLTMAGNKGVPFGIMPDLSTVLCPLLGVKSALAIGIKDCDLAEEHFTKLISTLLKLLQVPQLPWMSPCVIQNDTAVCNTPMTTRNVKIPIAKTTRSENTGTPRNRNTANPKCIEETPISNIATPKTVCSGVTPDVTPGNAGPIPGSISNEELTPRNNASKEINSTHLVTKRKRLQPSYHELNVKRTKVMVNSKTKNKK